MFYITFKISRNKLTNFELILWISHRARIDNARMRNSTLKTSNEKNSVYSNPCLFCFNQTFESFEKHRSAPLPKWAGSILWTNIFDQDTHNIFKIQVDVLNSFKPKLVHVFVRHSIVPWCEIECCHSNDTIIVVFHVKIVARFSATSFHHRACIPSHCIPNEETQHIYQYHSQ